MIKNTQELQGAELDVALAIALGLSLKQNAFGVWVFTTWGTEHFPFFVNTEVRKFHPTKDWEFMGQLIDHHGIEFKWVSDATIETYSYTLEEKRAYGSDHLESAARLLVLSILGEEVTIPDSTLEVNSGKSYS